MLFSDVYYRDPGLFGSQTVVNRYVDSIATWFSVPRSDLNIASLMTLTLWQNIADFDRLRLPKDLCVDLSPS